MKTSKVTEIAVEILWEYREFKRDETPAPAIGFLKRHTLEEITAHVSANGFEPLELSIVNNKALLTDGNHRIAAAKKLGLKTVPVRVTVFFGAGVETFYQHTLDRFKPISKTLAFEVKKLFINSHFSSIRNTSAR